MQKFFQLFGALMALLALPGQKRDEDQLGKLLGEAKAFIESDEAKQLGNLTEVKRQFEQLKADHDKTVENLRKLEKAGLKMQGHRIEVLGYREIMDLRQANRVFRYKDDAEGFGALVAHAVWGNTKRYEDVVAKRTRELADELIKDLDPGVAGSGAELVANIYMADLIANVEAVGTLFPLCDRVPLQTTGQTIWPKLTGELTAFPIAASAKIKESAQTYDTVPMTPIKWGVLTPIPNEFFRNPTLLDTLGQRTAWLITRAIPHAFDNAMVRGDGTADYGNITGLLQDANISAVTAAAATAIGSYTGADVGNVVAGINVDYALDLRWLMSLSAERKLRNVRDTLGHPLFDRGSNGEPNTVDGYPYSTCQRFPAAGSVGADTKWGAFGDLRLSHFFGMLGAIAIDTSEHVRFEHDMTVLRGIAMADAALKDANAVVTMKTHT